MDIQDESTFNKKNMPSSSPGANVQAPFFTINNKQQPINMMHGVKENQQADMVSGMSLGQTNKLYEPETMLKQQVKCNIQAQQLKIEFVAILEISDENYLLSFHPSRPVNLTQSSPPDNQLMAYLTVDYRVTESIGTNQNRLIIFINSNKNQQEQDNDQKDEEESVCDELIKLIRTERKGNFMMQGSCTLTIQFSSKQLMQKAYDLLSLYVGEEDEGASQYDQNQQFGEMISADNIDQNGNIILNNDEQEQNEEEEDEENQCEGEQQQGDMEDQSNQKK